MKKTYQGLLYASCLLGLLHSCQKTENITNIDHQNVVIEDNNPPYYSGVTTIQVQAYINRAYIDLIGREPNQTELDAHTQALKNNGLDSTTRAAMLNGILAQGEYYDYFHKVNMQRFLNTVDSVAVADRISSYTIAQQNAQAGGNTVQAQYLGFEIYRLNRLQNSKAELSNGNIDLNGYYTRLMDNIFYEEINMGSLNFVIACFENCLKRQPTDYEIQSGVAMCDGSSAYLFLQDGLSKGDFLRI